MVGEGSKGDSLFFIIHSLDRQKTPVKLPDNHRLKREKKMKIEVKYDGGPCLFNARIICDDMVEMIKCNLRVR